MRKLFVFILVFTFILYAYPVKAFDIDYGSIIGYDKTNALVRYHHIERSSYFLCSWKTLTCKASKKTSLGTPITSNVPTSIRKRLAPIKAHYISLSPDKKLLVYYLSPKAPENKRSFVIENLKTKKKYTFGESVAYWDLLTEQRAIFGFVPDKKTVIYLDDRDGSLQLYKTDTTQIVDEKLVDEKLATTGYTIVNFFIWDEKTIYYIANTKANQYDWALYEYDLESNLNMKIANHISHTGPLKRIREFLVFEKLENKGFGPRLYDPKKGHVENFNIPGINPIENTINEQEVSAGKTYGVVMKPDGLDLDLSKPYPLLIWLHGGPYRQTSIGYHPFHSYGIYDGILETLRQSGVIIFKLDYRGSLGFGRDYAESLKGSVGEIDVQDVMQAIEAIKGSYPSIEDIYLAGNSYGGYLSLRTIVENPDEFKGAMSINGVTDWESLLVRIGNSIFNVQFNGLPNKNNRALYDQASIFDSIKNLNKEKIIIIHSENDRTIPLVQAMLLVNKLKEHKKAYTFITYKNEDHVLKYKKNIFDLCRQMLIMVEKTSADCKK